ncbi:MAG: serine/threonine protein kinase [Comamonadaceae bacterium]|nr:serine/threonine protein kinase [Comamonadaceae bacterium]
MTFVHDEPDDDLNSQPLPSGVRLEEFEILHKVGEGGFSIVYKAWDLVLEREVALKEYLPASIAFRTGRTQVGVRSERNRQTFLAGLNGFVREAQTLASFNHPSLVRVFRFFHANGTAYMVMPLYVGRTFRSVVREMTVPPDEAWLKLLLRPLMEVLENMHTEGWYHRDIAPDNIMLVDGETRPILLDFGAARQVIGDMTQALTVVLKPGYAPIEQYAAIAEIKQGPWTDVYALAATIHWAITGKTPPISAGRLLHDTHIPLATSAQGKYSHQFLAGLDAALRVKPVDRTQNIAQFRSSIESDAPAPQPAPAVAPEPAVSASGGHGDILLPLRAHFARRGMIMALLGCAAGLAIMAIWHLTSREPNRGQSSPAPISTPSSVAVMPPQPVSIKPAPTAKPLASLAITKPVIQPAPVSAPAPAVSTPPSKVSPAPAPHKLAEAPRAAPAIKLRTNSVCDELLRKLSLGEGDSTLGDQLLANRCQQ